MQRPSHHHEISNEDYFPLVDSFSDVDAQDEVDFAADFGQLNTRYPTERVSAPQTANPEPDEAVLFPKPVADAAFYPHAVAGATHYPQARAVVYPQVPVAARCYLPAAAQHRPVPGGRYPMSGIGFPGPNDVMSGRGGATNQHVGNIRFRRLVAKHKMEYMTASRSEKPKIAARVVQAWRAQDPPGRFLTRSDPSMGDDSYWHDVGEKEAKKKASQCLREKSSDAVPELTKLDDEQRVEGTKQMLDLKPMAREPDTNGKVNMRTTYPLVGDSSVIGAFGFQQPTTVETAMRSSSRGRIEHKGARSNKGATSTPGVTTNPLSFSTHSVPAKVGPTESRGKSATTTPELTTNPPFVSTHSASARSGLTGATSKSTTSTQRTTTNQSASLTGPAPARVGPRLSLVKEKKVRHIDQEDPNSVPVAATLVTGTFDNLKREEPVARSDASALALPPDLLELMETSSIGALTDCMESVGTNQSTSTMESLSASSWFRSFQSLKKGKSNRTVTSMSTTGSSMQRIVEEMIDDMDESMDALDLAFPLDQEEFENRTANLQKLKSARSQISGFSLLSELTGDSSGQHRQSLDGSRRDSAYSIATTERLYGSSLDSGHSMATSEFLDGARSNSWRSRGTQMSCHSRGSLAGTRSDSVFSMETEMSDCLKGMDLAM